MIGMKEMKVNYTLFITNIIKVIAIKMMLLTIITLPM